MTGKRTLAVVGVAILLAGSGCASCNYRAFQPARDAGPDCQVPLQDRREVYVFLVNGLTPSGSSGRDGLQEKLALQGFTKVYHGQLYHAGWMGTEMRRIHREEPAARFVIVGYDLGGAGASRLAADGIADELPVDALILLDPMGKPGTVGCSVRTLLVCSGSGAAPVPHTESLSVPDAGHFTLPTHPQTVAVVCELLTQVARKVEHPPVTDGNSGWRYEHAPPPRPIAAPGVNADPEWSFLHDRGGTQNTPLTPIDATVSARLDTRTIISLPAQSVSGPLPKKWPGTP